MAKHPFTQSSSIDAKIQAARAKGESLDVCKVGDAEDIYYNLALSLIHTPARRMLDTGCYQGAFSRRLASVDGVDDVVGVDASTESIEVAKARYPQIRFLAGDFEHATLDGSFDYIFAMGWLHIKPLTAIDKCLRKFRGLLSTNGHLVITGGYQNWVDVTLENFRRSVAGHFELILELTYDKHIEYAPPNRLHFSKKHFIWLLRSTDLGAP